MEVFDGIGGHKEGEWIETKMEYTTIDTFLHNTRHSTLLELQPHALEVVFSTHIIYHLLCSYFQLLRFSSLNMFSSNQVFKGIVLGTGALAFMHYNTITRSSSLPPETPSSPSTSTPSSPRKLSKDRSLKLRNQKALSEEERERLLRGYLPADNDEEHMRNAFTHEIHCDSMIEH